MRCRWHRLLPLAVVSAVLLVGCADARSDRLSWTPAAPAVGPTLTSVPPGPDWERRQGEAALALVTEYPWRDLGWKIAFTGGEEGMIAETIPGRRVIEVHVRRGMPLDELAHAVAHEIGHAHDLTHGSDRCREAYKAARGVAAHPGWLDFEGGTDYGLPGGDYAEVFALWATRGLGPFKGTMAPRPSPDELRTLARPFFSPAGCEPPPNSGP